MKNLTKNLTKLTLTLIALSLIFTLSACSSTTNSEEAELKQQVSELQSQVNSLEEQVNPKPEIIPEEDIPDVDLMELAKKIVAECPPPEGVELVYDTENVEDMFNKGEDKENYVDLNNIDKVIRVYCTTPNESIYYFVIAKPKAGITVHENSKIRYSIEDTIYEFFNEMLDKSNSGTTNYYPACFGGRVCNYSYVVCTYDEYTLKEYETMLLDLDYCESTEKCLLEYFK